MTSPLCTFVVLGLGSLLSNVESKQNFYSAEETQNQIFSRIEKDAWLVSFTFCTTLLLHVSRASCWIRGKKSSGVVHKFLFLVRYALVFKLGHVSLYPYCSGTMALITKAGNKMKTFARRINATLNLNRNKVCTPFLMYSDLCEIKLQANGAGHPV